MFVSAKEDIITHLVQGELIIISLSFYATNSMTILSFFLKKAELFLD